MALARQQGEHAVHVVADVDCHDRSGHHGVDAGIERQAAGQCAPYKVPVSHDADESSVLNDSQGADAGCGLDCGIGRNCDARTFECLNRVHRLSS